MLITHEIGRWVESNTFRFSRFYEKGIWNKLSWNYKVKIIVNNYNRIQINANIRIRRIYFTNLPINSKKLPPEYKAFAAIQEDTANDKYGIDDL